MLSGSSLLVLGDFGLKNFVLLAEFIKQREFREPSLRLKKTLYYTDPNDLESENEIYRYHNIIVSFTVYQKMKEKLEKAAKTKNVIVILSDVGLPALVSDNGTKMKFMQLDYNLQALVNPIFYSYCHPQPH